MKALLVILMVAISANLFAQGTKPPVTTLSGLSDVNIGFINPLTLNDLLTYDSGSSKWTNAPFPLLTLGGAFSDVGISAVADKQVLRYNAAGSTWVNYGPLAFSDITGNITVSQTSGSGGANATTYWRGDNTWASPPVGSIPVTLDVLVGDNSGNATVSTLLSAQNANSTVYVSKAISAGDTTLKVQNAGVSLGATSSVMLSGLSIDPGATFRYYEGGYTTAGMIQNTDASLTTAQGRLLISGKNYILFSNDGTTLATERARIGNGLMIGTTIDKGGGTANVSGGYYVNGNKIGGVATVTTTTDQTGTSETVHLVYTVPANTVQVGTTFRIFSWGNIDNPTSAITYTPRIRWGGTGGVQLMATPTIVSTTSARSNADYELNGRVTVRTTGATGTAVAMLHLANHTSPATAIYTADDATSGATPITIDTTANKDIALTWTLSSPGGTPHVRTFGGVIEIVEP